MCEPMYYLSWYDKANAIEVKALIFDKDKNVLALYF
jgi:hypothetical protein